MPNIKMMNLEAGIIKVEAALKSELTGPLHSLSLDLPHEFK